jgi:hypothetical protein
MTTLAKDESAISGKTLIRTEEQLGLTVVEFDFGNLSRPNICHDGYFVIECKTEFR